MGERLVPPAGIQLSLDGVQTNVTPATSQAIDTATVNHFSALVLFVLQRLSPADQRRVLRRAYRGPGPR